jgi:hypothetical protein
MASGSGDKPVPAVGVVPTAGGFALTYGGTFGGGP